MFVQGDVADKTRAMEFVASLMPGIDKPAEWAKRREAEGWDGLSMGDHVAPSGRTFPHLWVTLTQLAAATDDLQIVAGFANSLTRAPADFAQAALTLQTVSGGRFEAGLGAGWAAKDSTAHGGTLPPPSERARRYRESVAIAADLLHYGRCEFHGRYFDLDIDEIGVTCAAPPPLVVAVGGPWVTRHVAPLGDRVEVAPFTPVLLGGSIDPKRWSTIDPDHTRQAIQLAKAANPAAPLSLGLFIAAGGPQDTEPIRRMFRGGPFEALAGRPADVMQHVLSYEPLGITRCTICALTPDTLQAFAAEFPAVS